MSRALSLACFLLAIILVHANAIAQIPEINVKDSEFSGRTILLRCDPQADDDKRMIGALFSQSNDPEHPPRTFDRGNFLNSKKFTNYFVKDTLVGFVVSEPELSKDKEKFVLVDTKSLLPETEMNFVGAFFTKEKEGGVELFCVLSSTNISMDMMQEAFFEKPQ